MEYSEKPKREIIERENFPFGILIKKTMISDKKKHPCDFAQGCFFLNCGSSGGIPLLGKGSEKSAGFAPIEWMATCKRGLMEFSSAKPFAEGEAECVPA